MRALALSSLSRKSFFSIISANCSFDSAKSNSSNNEGQSNTDTLHTTWEGGGRVGGGALSLNEFSRGYRVNPVIKKPPKLSLLVHCPWMQQLLSFVERAIIDEELP